VASHQLIGLLLSAIFTGCPIEMGGHIFLLKLLKPFFCDLKSKFPLNVKINVSGSMRKEVILFGTTFDPLINIRWTVPLNVG
jgi:hypothetical protein